MATPQFSVYTPQGLGTIPPATIGQNFMPAFGQGLLQVAKTYQARKSVEEAANQASTLFGDPTYGNIFRQMGLAAVAQGESPTPIINSMLSTAITLRRDNDQRAQQERMARMQFGQQRAMENLRTDNNLKEFGARTAYAEEQNSPNALYNRKLAEMGSSAAAAQSFSESPLGQSTAQAQEIDRQRKMANEIELESSKTRERRRAMNEVPLNIGGRGEDPQFIDYAADVGIDLDTSPIQMDPDYIQTQIEIIASDPKASRALQGRLRLLQDELKLRQDPSALRKRDKTIGNTPSGSAKPSSEAANKYLKL